MRTILKWSGIVLVNMLLVGVLLEVSLRLLTPALPAPLAAASRWVTTGEVYAAEWTPAWQQNRDHYYALRPDIDDALQYGSPSVSFRLSTIELWDGGGIGFRTAPVDFAVDTVVVGDSFGLCFTERSDCWVNQFAAQTGLGTVNLSQPVTGSTSHWRILRDFGAPLEPPLVVWQFFGNDFYDDYGLAVFRDEIDPVADPLSQTISSAATSPIAWLRQNSVTVTVTEMALTGRFAGLPTSDVKPHRVRYGSENEHVLQFGSQYEQIALDMTTEKNQIGLAYSREAFAQAQEAVASWGGEMVIVLIPTREEVYAHLTAPILGEDTLAQMASAREAMQQLCADLSLTCYDPIDVFRERAQAGEALYFSDDMHLNPHGNAVLAAALAAWLRDDNLLSE